jgi:Arc/MetJ family transcription regulator
MSIYIELDEKLVSETIKQSGANNEREAVEYALRRFLEVKKPRNLLDLSGEGGIREDYDYKKLRIGE